MMFKVTFNNISIISLRSVLLVEGTGVQVQLPCWHLQTFVTYIIRHIETIVGIKFLFADYLNQY
jgi:hypothetical protein